MRDGRIIESTLLGLYHRQRRQLSWLSVTVVPQYAADADGPHQVLSMFSDVTELKRDSALFDRVQALAHIGSWEWDCTSDRPEERRAGQGCVSTCSSRGARSHLTNNQENGYLY